MKHNIFVFSLLAVHMGLFQSCAMEKEIEEIRPNILFVMSDNQSYPHASAYGSKWINTPGFDYVAKEGIIFHNVFSASPGCAPSRSSILTGRYPWQNDEAGGHQTLYPVKYITFTDVLRSGKKLEDVEVPGFLPDHEVIRSDLLDYAYEIEWFDNHLSEMIQLLKEMGELENTVIIVTSDNGMQ